MCLYVNTQDVLYACYFCLLCIACMQSRSRVLAYKVRVSGSPQQASAASDRALPIEGLEELHCQHGGLLVVTLAVQWG